MSSHRRNSDPAEQGRVPRHAESTAPGSSPESSPRAVIVQHRREMPKETDRWFHIGCTLLVFAGTVAIAAATVASGSTVHPQTLWVAAGLIAIGTIPIFVAHREVNRGRRMTDYEVVIDTDSQ